MSFSNGARLQLINFLWRAFFGTKVPNETTDHRHPHDKTSGLSSNMALYPHKSKKLPGNSRRANETNKKKKEKKDTY
jgi:hypothetical protein